EITQWMQPEFHATPVSTAHAAQTAVTHLQRVGADDLQWYIYLPDARTAVTRIFEQRKPDPKAAKRRAPEIVLDPATGDDVHARE
ncbi:PepSY domain-containing protein, partial [Pseudomonas aeruginosa]